MNNDKNKIKKLSKKDRLKMVLRLNFLQGSWNYERMQNGGWIFSIIPAIRKLYIKKNDKIYALKRHIEFFNTHPYLAPSILGVVLALEEKKANGYYIEDKFIQSVKISMMGPFAGIGDPVFWFTFRPMLGALCASFAINGNIIGPIMFFFIWNFIRMFFMFYTEEICYKTGIKIVNKLSKKILQKINKGASILGMFVLGALVQRWVTIKLIFIISKIKKMKGFFIEWDKIEISKNGLKKIFQDIYNGKSVFNFKNITFQENLDQIIPGLIGCLLTILCVFLLKKKISPILIIIILFIFGILGHLCKIL